MAESPEIQEVHRVVIRFAGDSGDGMQLTGSQFSLASVVARKDISTLPEFPAEIRAPAGTLGGVSAFQIQVADQDILTPGDQPDVLVAMNPASLKVSLPELPRGALIIVNTDAFTAANLKKAGYERNPLEDGSLKDYQVIPVPITRLNRDAVKEVKGLDSKFVDRTKNFFALGLVYWLFDLPLEPTLEWIEKKFGRRNPAVAEANRRALQAGYHFGETTELFQRRYRIRKAHFPPGTYRRVTGNEAVAMGLVAAARKAGKRLFYGAYPITPASDILHHLALLRHFDVLAFQAEDEIAAMGAAVGAAFAGALAVVGTSGPGMLLKAEALNLAVMAELPVVVIDVQRAGPSTGMPTKVEQGDLLMAFYGRNGESPLIIVAPATPAECFDMAIEAVRLAFRAMAPVIYLSDGFLANSSEPWRIPDPEKLPALQVKHPTAPQNGRFLPFQRDPETLARPWALPGTPGLEHRIGGLEKEPGTGNVSYDPQHHRQMVQERAEKIARLAEVIPDVEVDGPEEGDLLLVGWGSTYGAIREAVYQAQQEGKSVAHVHLRYLNPFPRNLGDVLRRYRGILVPELNTGQLAQLLRARFLVDARPLPKVQGRPFKVREIKAAIDHWFQKRV